MRSQIEDVVAVVRDWVLLSDAVKERMFDGFFYCYPSFCVQVKHSF